MKALDIHPGQRFGKLVTVEKTAPQAIGKQIRRFWRCQCDCGATTCVLAFNLKDAASCGCIVRENAARMGHANRTHGRYGMRKRAERNGVRWACRIADRKVNIVWGWIGLRSSAGKQSCPQ
jgi:hypothetical protein